MAFKRNQLIAILFAGLVLVNGCALKQMVKLAKNQELTVTPNPLEVHGDSVAFEMTALLPLKMLKKIICWHSWRVWKPKEPTIYETKTCRKCGKVKTRERDFGWG